MKPMTKADVQTYLVEKGVFTPEVHFHTVDILEETDTAEGYVNHIFQVKDLVTQKSVVVKQVMPYMLAMVKATGEEHPFSMDRMRTEIRTLAFLNKLCAGIVPDVYLADYQAGIFVMEDLSHLDLMRFQITAGVEYPDFGKRMGAFLAGLCFYTSPDYLSPSAQKKMEAYFQSEESNRLNTFLTTDCPLINLAKPMEPENGPLRERIANNPDILKVVAHLSERFEHSHQCLSHNDLHTSNIMLNASELKILDTEFSGFSAGFMDMGRLTSSFILNYVSWLGTPEIPMATRTRMQAYNLRVIADLYHAFNRMFEKLWRTHGLGGDCTATVDAILRDALNYATVSATIRITSDFAQSCEIKRIKKREDLAHIQRRVLEVAEYTLLHQDQFHEIEDYCDFLRCCCDIAVQ